MVKMMVYDETIKFIRIFYKNDLFLNFSFLIQGSSRDYLGIENRFLIEKSVFNNCWDSIFLMFIEIH